MKAIINDKEVTFEVLNLNDDSIKLKIGKREFFYSKKELSLNVTEFNDKLQIFDQDLEAYAKILPKVNSAEALSMSTGSMLSPMPGKIFKVLKEEGSEVKKGEVILIMEAMKMEHSIKANKDGVLKKILFKEGEQVQGQSVLCELE